LSKDFKEYLHSVRKSISLISQMSIIFFKSSGLFSAIDFLFFFQKLFAECRGGKALGKDIFYFF